MKIKQLENSTFTALKEKFGYKNKLEAPRLVKIVVNVGIGSIKDKKKQDLIPDRLAKITGQKASPRGAKLSIASFKVRQGEIVGHQVTLRGQRMYDFLEKFLNVSIPRTRDFRGIPSKSIDEMGNYTVGIKEHIIFPETVDEELKDIFGMSITFVTTSSKKEETKAFLEHLGFPFKKAVTEAEEALEKKSRKRERKAKVEKPEAK